MYYKIDDPNQKNKKYMNVFKELHYGDEIYFDIDDIFDFTDSDIYITEGIIPSDATIKTIDTELYIDKIIPGRKYKLNDLHNIIHFLDKKNSKNIANWAARNGYLDIVKYLVFMNINLNEDHECIFLNACRKGHLKIVEYISLLLHKNCGDYAFREACDNNQLKIIKHIIFSNFKLNIEYGIDISIKMGYLEILKYLMFMINDISIRPSIFAEFAERVGSNHVAVVKYCIFLNIDIDLDLSLIIWAYKRGQLEIIYYLFSIAENQCIFMDIMLQFAIEYGQLHIIKYVYFLSTRIKTIIKYANRGGNVKVIKFLIYQGANIETADNYIIRGLVKNNHLKVVKYLIPILSDINPSII